MTAARARAISKDQADWMERLVANAPSYLEPWQREPVDPTLEHIVTLERRGEFPHDRMRASCSCGLDRGWQESLLGAKQDADFHRGHVRDSKVERGLDSLPIPLIERQDRHGGPLFRWTCHCASGPWLVSEAVAALCSILHTQDCDERRRSADLAPSSRRPRRP